MDALARLFYLSGPLDGPLQMRILLAFALSILVWWLLTDDDAPAPVKGTGLEPEPSETGAGSEVAAPTVPSAPGFLGFRWACNVLRQWYCRAKTYGALFRTRLPRARK